MESAEWAPPAGSVDCESNRLALHKKDKVVPQRPSAYIIVRGDHRGLQVELVSHTGYYCSGKIVTIKRLAPQLGAAPGKDGRRSLLSCLRIAGLLRARGRRQFSVATNDGTCSRRRSEGDLRG